MAPVAPVRFEACVTSVAQARRAFVHGAHRIELCARLDLDGLTPRPATIAATTRLPFPVHVMIRPRGGDSCYHPEEVSRMVSAARMAARHGAAALVTGALTPDGLVDRDVLRAIRRVAPLPIVFHRAFDQAHDPAEALETLVRLRVAGVLTSGGASSAWAGRRAIARLERQARGRIAIIAAGRVRASNVRAVVRATGVRVVHAHVDGRALERLSATVSGAAAGPARSPHAGARATAAE